MKTNSIIDIELSPFWISELFPYFFNGYNKSIIDYSVIGLIVPFVLTKSIRENILVSANSKSSFNSLFFNPARGRKTIFTSNDNSLINKSSLSDIPLKYHANKELTKKAIFIAYEKKYIDFSDGRIKVIVKKDYKKDNDTNFLRDYFKSAQNLGNVFKNEEVKNLFLKCNIHQL